MYDEFNKHLHDEFQRERQASAFIICIMLFGICLGILTTLVSTDDQYVKPPVTTESIIYTEQPIVTETPEPTIEPTPEPTSTPFVPPYTDEEINLIAIVTMAEAESESDYGKRLVIDVILNRVEHHRFANTVSGVIYSPGQFEVVRNGRINKCYVKEDIRKLVVEEMEHRTNEWVLFFRADYYHPIYVPVTQVGNHYFSTFMCTCC